MQTICLANVLPQVFSNVTDLKSDVWKKNIQFEKGKTYLVEAMSGTGKSTLCSYILGYRHDYTGRIRFDQTDIKDLSISDWVGIRKQSISHLFQELRLFSELTAMENIQIKNNLTEWKDKAEITRWFEMLGIADKVDSKIGRMSFGQQQRVAMIRALVQPFDFILADEPISHLDDKNSILMAELMMTEAKKQGAGVIVTSIGKHMDLPYDRIYRL